MAAAAEIALVTPTLDNNLDRVYYSFKTDFRMEPYLTQLHRGPLRTTLARFRLGQHWLQTRLGRFGPHRVPYESRWCQHCASVNQHKAVDSEEHAWFECPPLPWSSATTAMGPTTTMQLAGFHGAATTAASKLSSSLLRSALRKGLDPCARAVTAALVAYACSGFAST